MVRSRTAAMTAGNGRGAGIQPAPMPGRWGPHDRARALERLAEARANLAGLERRDAPAVDPSIRDAVEQRQSQINELREGTARRGRSGRQARQQLEALEGTQGMVIECLGFHSYDEFRSATQRFDATRVDQRMMAAARDEVAIAERHFFDTAEMAIPVPTPPGPAPQHTRQMAPVPPIAAPGFRPPAARRAG
jgi:hypothetical protein